MEIILKILFGGNYHKDFLIKVRTHKEYADTYYFWRDEFGELDDPYNGLFKEIDMYLGCWVNYLKSLSNKDKTFLPINFSDQYIGGFKVEVSEHFFNISYGYLYDIDNLIVRVTADNAYTNLDYEKMDTIDSFKMEKVAFYDSLSLGKDNRFFN